MNHLVYLDMEDHIHTARAREIDHPHHTLYHVEFDDGYENMFFTDVETNQWIEEDLGTTKLAKIFGREVSCLRLLSNRCPKILSWHSSYIQGFLVHFGFYKYEQGTKSVYEIYGANRKFKYNLVNRGDGNWEIYGAYNLFFSEIDIEKADMIVKILESYSSCP